MTYVAATCRRRGEMQVSVSSLLYGAVRRRYESHGVYGQGDDGGRDDVGDGLGAGRLSEKLM